ncbi:RNase A-like domain-containing protein [Vreelandella zhanjiangensis]|uniref:RNase A-like domain-containing protein n=1 Tax=Vreelandella zhanjiangensis TaxID=1121960 RepID=UPI0035304B8B
MGSPVNPLLGAKLLPAETDFALPAPRPFVFSRGYLSSNARIGVLGQGWSLPGESLAITLKDDACIVHDAQGRAITFGPLGPGQARFSPTEQLWIRRGGSSAKDNALSDDLRWQALDETLRDDPARIVLSDTGGLYYVFARPEEAGTRWPLIDERDRNGYATAYQWDNGLLTRAIDSAGRHYQFVYDALLPRQADDAGQRLTGVKLVQDHDGSVQDDWLVRYSFSAAGDLLAVRHRHGEVVREFEWQEHMLIAHRVPGGMEAHYTWDRHAPDGRVIGQQEAGGLARRYTYHVDHTQVTDSLGREETYHFVGSGPGKRWTAHTRADGSRIEFRYDRAGHKVATIDPLGRETLIERDDSGQVIGQVTPDGQRWTLERNAMGDTSSVEGPENQRWQITRNERGQPLEITGPEGTTTFAYDDERLPDRPTTVTDPVGATHQREWNALGQVTAQIDCSEQRTEYTYDRHGFLASITNALGETTRTQHDEMGRRTATQQPDGLYWHQHYDPQGRLVEVEGPQGFRQQFFFDEHGRPAQRIEADGSHQFTAYDEVGRLSELTLGNGAVYRFTYDAMDRLASETGPDGREQQYRYDEAGQLIERIEAGRSGPDDQPLATRYEYDAAGRLAARHLPATEHAPASNEHYRWSANGQLAGVTNEHGEVTFAYDPTRRLLVEHQRHVGIDGDSGWQWQQHHTLTANGAPQQSQFGALPALNWHTYGSGHLHGMSAPELNLEIDLTPDALHRETQRRLSLGSSEQTQPLIIERGYTELGQLDHLTLHGAQNGSGQQYQYDALGRMSFRSLKGNPAEKVIAYRYNAAGYLIGSQHSDHAHRYSVDAAGNRLEPQGNQQTLPDNRLTQLNGARYRYDGAGNLIERQQPDGERLNMGFDAANRLVQLTHTSPYGHTTEATYRYDGLGRRISKTVRHTDGTTATTHYGWDGDRIVREDTENQRTTVVYEPGRFVPMLRIDDTQQGPSVSAYITDALGTPMQLVTPSGQPRWLAEPDDWAAVKNQRAVRNVTQPIRFQGQWHDEESGLYYNRHRYYDPQQGRYISQDPIGLKGGTNLYGYVTNPTGMVDPLGLAGAAVATSAAEGAAALGGRVTIPKWATNPVGAFVLGMWPTPMGDGTTEGPLYTGTVFAPADRQSSPSTPIDRPSRPDTPTERLGRYDTPIVDQHGWTTERPSLQPGGCRSEQPIGEQISCPSELPIIEQGGWASGLPIAGPLQGDNTIGGGYQPAGTDMIGGAVYSSASNETSLIKSETGGTLIFHENLDGHTIRRHVGKTDEQLLQRLEAEPDILGSSTYPDLETAQRATGEVLSRNRDSIQNWLTSSKNRLPLDETLDYEVGRVIPQGATASQLTNRAFVLLAKDSMSPSGYRVHTSFPKP